MAQSKKLSHVWIADYLADALELEGAMDKEMDIAVNKKRMKIPSMTSEVITPESATKPLTGGKNDYIVYGLERDDRIDEPYKKNRTMSMYIYANTQSAGQKIIDTIMEYTGDSDAICNDLDVYQREKGGGRFRYLSMQYRLLNGPEPLNMGSEGGLFGALVLLAYSYTYPMDSTGISL